MTVTELLVNAGCCVAVVAVIAVAITLLARALHDIGRW